MIASSKNGNYETALARLLMDARALPMGNVSQSVRDQEHADLSSAISEALVAGVTEESIFRRLHDGGQGLGSVKVRSLLLLALHTGQGVSPELKRQAEVTIAPFTVFTAGEPDDMQLTGATISDDEMAELLHYEDVAVEDRKGNGVVYAHNQDGVLVELMLDMDQQTPVVRPVCLSPAGVQYLNSRDGLMEESGMRP